MAHLDWAPTLPGSGRRSGRKGAARSRAYKVGDTTFKVHLDGYNLLPFLTGETKESPRKEFFYFNDDSELVAFRYDNWKIVFVEQRIPGTLRIWAEPFVTLRVPKLFNLRTDPYERADITSNTYYDWLMDHVFIFVPAQTIVGQFLATFREYPAASQEAGSFSLKRDGKTGAGAMGGSR